MFSPSIAQDGLLSRLRIPGGLLTVPQCEAIADLADQSGGGYIEVTNRANVQIRELQASIDPDRLTRLQAVRLASPVAEVDALRNIMGSPTAGIDRQQLMDTRPLVAAWNRYLTTRPDFAVLSPNLALVLTVVKPFRCAIDPTISAWLQWLSQTQFTFVST